ncbi:hypothetical protein M5689_003188 [Euphorbia peplus]|nr:hypothetical protein M5689_003188 [Euphorbia peplus]
MDPSLIELMAKVNLTEKETKVVGLKQSPKKPNDNQGPHKLIGRVLSYKPLNLRGMAQAFLSAWKFKEFQLKELGNDMFLCKLKSYRHKIKVLNEGPCHFERHIVIFKDTAGIEQLSDGIAFWIRIFNLPLTKKPSQLLLLKYAK